MDRREADDVVLDDERGLQLVEDLPQAVVDVGGAVAQGTERRLDERLELLDRRRPKDRRRLADEVLPELTRCLGHLGHRPEPHQPLLEALRLEAARERFLDDEHDPMPALAQNLADPDAVVRRAVGPFGKEDNGGGVAHGQCGCADHCGTVRVRRSRRSSVGGEATRSTRRSQGTIASAEAIVSGLRPELEHARWYHGKGRELASVRLRRPLSPCRAAPGAPRDPGRRVQPTAARPNTRSRRRSILTGPSKPPSPPTRFGPRSRGWP